MARKAKDPQQRIDDLERQKIKLAVEKDGIERLVHWAHAVLEIPERGPNTAGQGTIHRPPEGEGTLPQRRQAAEEAQDLGHEHEPAEALAKDEQKAREALALRPKIASKTGAMSTLSEEIADVRANNLEFFARKAHARSLEAVAATEARKQAQADEELARKSAEEDWGIVRDGRARRKWPLLRGIPSAEGLKEGRAPWPGGRELDEESLRGTWQNDDDPRAPRMSNAEALAQFAGGRV